MRPILFASVVPFLLLTGVASFAYGEPVITADEIQAYLLSKGSPIAEDPENAAIFVARGIEFDVDPRLIVAIAGAETTFGTNICPDNPRLPPDYNAWNWFWEGRGCPDSPFSSWNEAITSLTKFIRRSYINTGLTTIPLIGAKYCAEIQHHQRLRR